MISRIFIEILVILLLCSSCSDEESELEQRLTFPSFGNEKTVTIEGLTFDAMEPFISPDGKSLYFNSINNGINTKLFIAARLNDSTFIFKGELVGPNQVVEPHLDAVPDTDANGNFYWTSTRNYPAKLDNLFGGNIKDGAVSNIQRVRGNFNMNIPGWLVMDHGISLDGQFLYFNHARFDNENCVGPCETVIGIAKRDSAFWFSKSPDSESILQNINDPNYIYYAPCISSDNKEFYYTRFLKGEITPKTIVEICVAIRKNDSDVFSAPITLFSEEVANIVEAPTLTTDKNIMYYHKKVAGIHRIMMRHRKS